MNKNIIIDNKLHKLIKIRASKEYKSIKGLVTELIENYLSITPEDYMSDEKKLFLFRSLIICFYNNIG